MSLFQNNHLFSRAIKCCPPLGHRMPVVAVEMAGASGEFAPVVGKVDTGAFRTMLDFATAQALGIENPVASAQQQGTAQTATGEPFPYYVHSILVQVSDAIGPSIVFPLMVAFSDKVKRNLFGVDWLHHLCLAVDRQAVHFLKD